MILGLDFDNTLISYDDLFYKAAKEKRLIPAALKKEKNAVRDYLRASGMEDEWTRLQGEVYGDRIKEAKPYEGMLDALKALTAENVLMYIISHKTRTPYLGLKRDLHAAARGWLKMHGITDSKSMNWDEERIFFELTKEMKVERIIKMGCTCYVDDLIDILELLPDTIHKILFSPNSSPEIPENWSIMKTWKTLPKLLLKNRVGK